VTKIKAAQYQSGSVPVVGTIQTVTSTGYTVTVGSDTFTAFPAGYIATAGESVRVMFLGTKGNEVAYVLGPSVPYPTRGVIASVGTNTVNLTVSYAPAPWAVDSTTIKAGFTSPVTPSVGQKMAILWSGGPTAIGYGSPSAVGSEPDAPPAPATPTPPAPTTHVLTFRATNTGTWSQTSNDWFNSQVWASATCLGLWVYGSSIADTIPAAADPTYSKVELYLSPDQIDGSNPNFAIHNYASIPSGAPSLTTVSTQAARSGWITLETANGNGIFSALNSGSAKGIGCNHGGFNIFNSLNSDGASGMLRITAAF